MGEVMSALRATLEQFHAFRDERPKEEKWELIGGVMTMMPPPALMHHRICGNVATLLNAALSVVKPEWRADREVRLLLPDNDTYNPEPDVTVIDTKIKADQIYAERFYFVAEILSPNDKPRILELKRAFYQAHEYCRGVMFVKQDRIEAELMVRNGAVWISRKIETTSDAIVIPDIGDIGTLGALYRHTPLHQAD